MPVGLLAITVFVARVDAPLQIGKISILLASAYVWHAEAAAGQCAEPVQALLMRAFILTIFPLPFVRMHMCTRNAPLEAT